MDMQRRVALKLSRINRKAAENRAIKDKENREELQTKIRGQEYIAQCRNEARTRRMLAFTALRKSAMPDIKSWSSMRLRILIPCYKRAEFLEVCLQSLYPELNEVYVADDGTPDDTVRTVCDKYGVHYKKFKHRGIVPTVTDLIRWGCENSGEDTVIYLSANDHKFPEAWSTNFRKAAAFGLKYGEMGMVDHVPGPNCYRYWRAAATKLEPDILVNTNLSGGGGICSMPSIMSVRGALQLADYLEEHQNKYIEKFDAKRIQMLFCEFWVEYLRKHKQTMFAILGKKCCIEHFGHHLGPNHLMSPESSGYYGEVGRYQFRRIIFVVGARPNFIKIAPLYRAILAYKFKSVGVQIAHTGQHYDDALDRKIIRSLGLPDPTWRGDCADVDAERMIQRATNWLLDIFNNNPPIAVVVVGDVNSTVAGAMAAKQYGKCDLIHVESGLRSGDMSMPEERNRIYVDRVSDLLLASEPSAIANLVSEGVCGKPVLVGSLTVDACLKYNVQTSILQELGLNPGDYLLVTIHRPSNVDTEKDLRRTLELLDVAGKTSGKPLIWPAHPRSSSSLAKYKLQVPACIRIIDPLDYLDFMCLERGASIVLTDSGGIQEETTVLGIPCITLRTTTERPITVERGTNILLSSLSTADMEKAVRSPKTGQSIEYWDGQAAVRSASSIVLYLKDRLKSQLI